MTLVDPREAGPRPPFETPQQAVPGKQTSMVPLPDCGEDSYVGTGALLGRKALVTGGDSGIGRAVAIAFAREGADVAISYLDGEVEKTDAESTAELVRAAGKRCLLIPGDIGQKRQCESRISTVLGELGGLDVLVNNAAFQMAHKDLQDVSEEEFDRTFRTNVYGTFFLSQAAAAHMPPGSSIINTVSVNSDKPNATLVAYAATKGALQNLTGGLAQLLANKGIRVNCVAPGPVWTPLIPSTLDAESVKNFGKQTPVGRPAQPAELAGPYVLLASAEASYISGATIAVTGGVPFI